MHVKNAQVIDFDTDRYDFRRWVQTVLDFQELELIHTRPDVAAYSAADVKDQINICRQPVVDAFEDVAALYGSFVEQVIGCRFGGIVSYQTPPSFRFHYSHRGSTSIHRDRDFGVKSDRLNAWVPLTKVWGDNSICIETEEGVGDLSPVHLDYGQILIFDGGNLLHGSQWNSTPATRVSFDLRFIPLVPPTPRQGEWSFD